MNPFEAGPGQPRDAALSMFAECTQTIFRRRPGALLSHLPVIVLAAWLGWDSPARLSNLVFVGLLLLYVVAGIAWARAFNARPTTEALALRGARHLYVTLAALGVVYNLIFLNLDRHGVAHALQYQLLIVSLFSAGAAASYQHLRGLAAVFIVSSTAPLAAYQLWRGGPQGHVIAVLLAVFMIFMSSVTFGLHRDAVERLMLIRQLETAKEEAERQARVDGLTGLLNRAAFFDAGRALLSLAQRHDRPLSIVMVDLDHFKSINDRFGHAAGDEVLTRFADTVRGATRTSDLCGRLGGEEFAILLPEATAADAVRFAERLREAVLSIPAGNAGHPLSITASFGIAERMEHDHGLDSLIDRADKALYSAKAQGRDRIVTHPGDPSAQARA